LWPAERNRRRAVLEDGKGKWEYFGPLVVFE
jgi:hypothetical protein